jgi:hypothetical protein
MKMVPTLNLNGVRLGKPILLRDLQVTSLVKSINNEQTPFSRNIKSSKRKTSSINEKIFHQSAHEMKEKAKTEHQQQQPQQLENLEEKSKPLLSIRMKTNRSKNAIPVANTATTILLQKADERDDKLLKIQDTVRETARVSERTVGRSTARSRTALGSTVRNSTARRTAHASGRKRLKPSSSTPSLLIESTLVSTLVNDINNTISDSINYPITSRKTVAVGRMNTERTSTGRRSRPETNRTTSTSRSSLSTARSTSSIVSSAKYTSRYNNRPSTVKKTRQIEHDPSTWKSTAAIWDRSKNFSTTADMRKGDNDGKYKPWNKIGLSKKGMKSRQLSRELHRSGNSRSVDIVEETRRELQQSQSALTVVEREHLAEKFNEILDNNLIEQAARLQLQRGGRFCKAIHKVDSLRGPGALYLKAKGDVAVHVDPPPFSKLGKTMTSLASKTLESSMGGPTKNIATTSGHTYTKQPYVSTIRDQKIHKNVHHEFSHYLEESMKHDHELRGLSLLIPKSQSFTKLQTHEEIQKREHKMIKFKMIKQMTDDYVCNMHQDKITKKKDHYNLLKIQREDKEKRLGIVPTGKRIGGGYTGVVRRKHRTPLLR